MDPRTCYTCEDYAMFAIKAANASMTATDERTSNRLYCEASTAAEKATRYAETPEQRALGRRAKTFAKRAFVAFAKRIA